jgi:hypothetical protein
LCRGQGEPFGKPVRCQFLCTQSSSRRLALVFGLSTSRTEPWQLTHELSCTLRILGANCDVGKFGPRPLPVTGEPSPAMPDTLCRLVVLPFAPFVLPFVQAVKGGLGRGTSRVEADFSCKLSAESDRWASDGGVSEPLVGVAPWLPSLDVSVDCSVRKLALDRLRICLKLKKEGAMI